MNFIKKYYHWLHGQWPAGAVEKLPVVGEDGLTNQEGVRIVGDLSGVPLLKFSSETGTKAVQAILAEPSFPAQRAKAKETAVYDLAIIGGGVSGISAAMEAKKAGLKYVLIETSEAFSTVKNFPKGKPIFTYPTDMTPSGGVQYGDRAGIKESLLEEMQEQIVEAGIEITSGRVEQIAKKDGLFVLENANAKEKEAWTALRVVVAIGRSGNFRKLNVPGEGKDKVMNRLHDPKVYQGKKVLVVGGGDSAIEAAMAIAEGEGEVTLSYRSPALTRPKPDNIERIEQAAQDGLLTLALGTQVKEITDTHVTLIDKETKAESSIENDSVFTLIGREAPLEFFRRSNITISGERNMNWWVTAALAALLMTFVYQWKKGGTWLPINEWWSSNNLFPFGLSEWWVSQGGDFADPKSPLGILQYVASDPGFFYSFAYCIIIVVFGFRRIQRRKTPYVKRQTITLGLIQIIPLFLLPYIVLPLMGANGLFDSGVSKWLADEFFPEVNYGSGREYWRAFGVILAWPLFFWNVFTKDPMWGWLIVSCFQTFVVVPWIVRRWGKGAYCGWICSCGALAETLGDAHRHKMPHGPLSNKLNMIGQVFLGMAFVILISRVLAWAHVPFFKEVYQFLLYGSPNGGIAQAWSYVWFVDLLFAGIIGVAFYFHFSGRVWCRFACPLAALMHIYSRFSKFRIFADKKKCISCNVCTSVCHQGIDVMNFANKGKPMADPQCVRCSACVQSCPTGVLKFGRYTTNPETGEKEKIVFDQLPASLVEMAESKK